ncbi:acyltransferase [Curtobacterium sp. VKM Ac-2922]|uniref:acyltransferase family protein n=1 Tax=Curtobacterium sp. VKM Ac-2922 TaxID=2929475 RepID=UPI001FB2BB31|nr:acyltransferase [Curtobacterium sp. VKM Ac-2922]MCJ1715822.1 acyltransferase [Curtobacterium sp. VKM Ac-2922]
MSHLLVSSLSPPHRGYGQRLRFAGRCPNTALGLMDSDAAPAADRTTMTTNVSPAPRDSHLPSLTGLRWIAAGTVFAFHLTTVGFFTGKAATLLSGLAGAGATGVSLFFMLSGFVLAWTDAPGTGPLRFWRRRIARVVPLHLVTVALALVVAATLVPSIATLSARALVANVLLVSAWHAPWWQAGNPVSWSLVCEAFFYAVFPFLMVPLRRAPAWALWTVGALALAAVLLVPTSLHLLPGDLSTDTWPPARFPEFVLGVVGACLVRSGAWRGPRLPVPLTLTVLGFAVANLLRSTPLALTGYTAIGFALLLPALARWDRERRPSVLASPLLVGLGERSFAFYLVHVLVLQSVLASLPAAATRTAPENALVAAAAFVTALGLASVLHVLIEVAARQVIAGSGRTGPQRRSRVGLAGRTDVPMPTTPTR